eukprot:Gb_14757 [translate_table: standard]
MAPDSKHTNQYNYPSAIDLGNFIHSYVEPLYAPRFGGYSITVITRSPYKNYVIMYIGNDLLAKLKIADGLASSNTAYGVMFIRDSDLGTPRVARKLEFLVGRNNGNPDTDFLEEAMVVLQRHDEVGDTENVVNSDFLFLMSGKLNKSGGDIVLESTRIQMVFCNSTRELKQIRDHEHGVDLPIQ